MNRGVHLYRSIDKKKFSTIDRIRNIVPVNIEKIIDKLGIELKGDILPADVSGAIRKDGDKITIYYDIIEPTTRQRFTMAHELAHYLLGHLDDNIYISDNILLRSDKLTNTDERDANYLAAELLMPMSKIDQILSTNSLSMDELAGRLAVSEQAIAVRLGIV